MHMLGLSTGSFLSPFLTLYDRRLCVPGFSDSPGHHMDHFFTLVCFHPSSLFLLVVADSDESLSTAVLAVVDQLSIP